MNLTRKDFNLLQSARLLAFCEQVSDEHRIEGLVKVYDFAKSELQCSGERIKLIAERRYHKLLQTMDVRELTGLTIDGPWWEKK